MPSPSSLAAVLFDLDGTLLDTALDFETATNRLLQEEGRPTVDSEKMRQYVTDGSRGIIFMAFGIDMDSPDFSRLQQTLLSYYRECLTERTCIFPGLEATLNLLAEREIPWGLVTNKPEEYAAPIVESIVPECSVLVCPDHVQIAKPDPEGMLLACAKIQVEPENCLYIGDHRRDIQAGEAAGMKTVAVDWGYIDHSTEDIDSWNATHRIKSPSDLSDLIRSKYL